MIYASFWGYEKGCRVSRHPFEKSILISVMVFISQIMTSKSPVRSCEDVDATALSFAEIKALCAGDPRIKERMDLDIEVSKLKIMKADHNSKQFRLEDSLLKYFPEKIEEHKGFVRGLEADMHPKAYQTRRRFHAEQKIL